MIEHNIFLLGACSLLSAIAHFAGKWGKVNAIKPTPPCKFLRGEISHVITSLCTIGVICIAHENIAKINYAGNLAGDYLYIVFAALGWFSSSVMYRVFGVMEKRYIKDLRG